MKIMATFKRSCACTAALSTHDATAGHCRPTPPLETPGHSQASLGQSLFGSPLLSPGSWCTRFCLCPPRVYFPALCKFWQLYGGVNGNLLQKGLCHNQVYCKKAKWLSEEALQIAMKRREAKGKREKIYPFEYRVPKNSREGTQLYPSTENWIKDLLSMALPTEQDPVSPIVSLSHQEAFISLLSFSIRG